MEPNMRRRIQPASLAVFIFCTLTLALSVLALCWWIPIDSALVDAADVADKMGSLPPHELGITPVLEVLTALAFAATVVSLVVVLRGLAKIQNPPSETMGPASSGSSSTRSRSSITP